MDKIIQSLNTLGSWAKWAIYQGVRLAVVSTLFMPLLIAVTNIFLMAYAAFALSSLATSFMFGSFRSSLAKFAAWVFTGDRGIPVAQGLFKDTSESIAAAFVNNTINAIKIFPLVLIASATFTLGYSVYFGTQFADLADGIMDLIAMPFNYLFGAQSAKPTVPVAEVVKEPTSHVPSDPEAVPAKSLAGLTTTPGQAQGSDDDVDLELDAIHRAAQLRTAQTQATATQSGTGASIFYGFAPVNTNFLSLLAASENNAQQTHTATTSQRAPNPAVDWD